jgi:hypothetical protein
VLVGELAWAAAPAAGRLAYAGELPRAAAPEVGRCAGGLARACSPADGLLADAEGGRCWSSVPCWDLDENEELGKRRKRKSFGRDR